MFIQSWQQREADMRRHSGFLDFAINQDGEHFTVSSRCGDRHMACVSGRGVLVVLQHQLVAAQAALCCAVRCALALGACPAAQLYPNT